MVAVVVFVCDTVLVVAVVLDVVCDTVLVVAGGLVVVCDTSLINNFQGFRMTLEAALCQNLQPQFRALIHW